MSRPVLSRALVLEAPEDLADGMGGRQRVWRVLGTLWAEVAPRTGRETRGPSDALSDTGYRITVRAAPVGAKSRPRAGQRFADGPRHFRIEAVTERDPKGRYLTCFASEEVTP